MVNVSTFNDINIIIYKRHLFINNIKSRRDSFRKDAASEWKKDKDRNSRCLYYLIKYFYSGNGRKDIGSSALPNGKYERMKRFFICKTDIPNPSSYAIGSSAFRKKLKEFFSEKFEERI